MQITSENSHGFDIHPVWGEFRDKETEREFLRHHLVRGHSQLRITLIFCSFFYVAFSLTDIAVLGCTHTSLMLFVFRSLVAVTAGAAIYLIHRQPSSITIPALTATAVEIVGMGTFMIISLYRPNEMPWHAMSVAIMLIVVYLFIPNRLMFSLSVALVSTTVFIFVAMEVGNLKPADMVTMIMLLVLTNTFGIFAARRYQRLWRDEFGAQSVLKRQSVRDHLTGCYNRRHLHDTILEKEIVRAQRHGLWLTVVLCDLDHFKSVNDTYGHSAGDAVLRTFSALLQQATREHVDCVIRYGGEEFLLVLPETDLSGGMMLADRLRVAFADSPTVHAGGQEIRLTASFGVASINFASEGKAISQYALIAAADKLLYEAKNSGRNHITAREL